MLLVPVRVGPSAIHGLGVFTTEPIAAGTVVWRFTPGFDLELDPRRVDEQPPLLRGVLLHYGYIDPRRQRYILCCDDARFLNHSECPNLGPRFDADPWGIDVALGSIAAGEELTLDYQAVEGSRPGPS